MSTISASTTTTTAYKVAADTTGTLVLQTGATPTTAVTIDGSQNVGVGVTPSAWSTFKGLQIVGGSLMSFSNAYADLFQNTYFDGSNLRYVNTGFASYYRQTSGVHSWSTAASGSAGGVATFTQAMTLDASGNLGVGTSSPSAKLDVNGAIKVAANSGVAFGTNGFLYGGDASDMYFGTSAAYNIRFYINGAERARIDSSGNLLVGQTSQSNTTVGASFSGAGASAGAGYLSSCVAASTSGFTNFNMYSTGAGAYRFYVDMGGTVHATSVVITAISDERLKENVRDIDTGLSTVMALKPRRYDWKEGKGLDKKNAAGFIAQEFEQVFPDSVGLSKAGEDGIEYKNINYEELIPTLTKAIQEQQAIIQAQAADIAALKAKVGI